MKPRHGGNLARWAAIAGVDPDRILDFSANMNPAGPPGWLRRAFTGSLASVAHYPDPEQTALRHAAARRYGVAPNTVLAVNGTSEAIQLLPRAFPVRRALLPSPCYVDYARSCELAGIPVENLLLPEEQGFVLPVDLLDSAILPGDLVWIARPNNPTGLLPKADEVRELVLQHPDAIFALDEAFIELAQDGESLIAARPANAIILLSLTKSYAIPGLRLGLCFGEEDSMAALRRLQAEWSVNTPALAVGVRAMADKEYLIGSRNLLYRLREDLLASLREMDGLATFPGEANFLLLRIEKEHLSRGCDANALCRDLLDRHRIAIRVCDNYYGLDARFFRIAVRPSRDNAKLVQALDDVLRSQRRGACRGMGP